MYLFASEHNSYNLCVCLDFFSLINWYLNYYSKMNSDEVILLVEANRLFTGLLI